MFQSKIIDQISSLCPLCNAFGLGFQPGPLVIRKRVLKLNTGIYTTFLQPKKSDIFDTFKEEETTTKEHIA